MLCMKLVLLFFCIILIIFLSVLFSNVRLNVQQFYISNIENDRKIKDVKKNFLIYLELYLFGAVKIAKVKVTKNKLQKLKIKGDIKSLEKDAFMIKDLKIIEDLKKLKAKTKKINVDIQVGTDSLNLTVYVVAFVSTLIRNFIL